MKTITYKERCELVNRICKKAADETESWKSEDCVGADLAYLCWAICGGPGEHVFWLEGDPIVHLFREWFTPDDPVWDFIAASPKKIN